MIHRGPRAADRSMIKTLLDDRRLLLPVLLTAVAIAVGSVLIVMLSDDASGAGPAPSPAVAAHGAVTIDIADFMYKPVSVTVKAGSKVRWVNHDQAPHTATAGGAGGFDTDTLKKGDSKTLKLAKPGTYAYICEFHPFMKATVIVK
jgi:plastocyanin